MRLITQETHKLALHLRPEDFRPGLSFFSEDQDFLQVGAWNYDRGKILLAHTHNLVERTVTRTQEFIYVVKGAVKAMIYDQSETMVEELILGPQEGLLLFAGGHGYEILEDETVVIEIKNGPYLGAETDRRRLGVLAPTT
jgi:hypothetical protein